MEATLRRAMTPARRQEVLAKFNRRCAYPQCGVEHGLEIDHVIPLELGGVDELHNLQPLCEPHHKAKTRLDVKLIAKARRLRLVARGERERKPSRMKSRGFSKAMRRRMNGTVEHVSGGSRGGL